MQEEANAAGWFLGQVAEKLRTAVATRQNGPPALPARAPLKRSAFGAGLVATTPATTRTSGC